MAEKAKINTGHEGSIADQVKAYFSRLKAGDMGALPAVAAVVVLMALFANLSPFFLTEINIANLFVQSAVLMVTAMALVFVLLLAEIDLSAGVTAATGMAIFVKMTYDGWDWPIALAVGFLFGLAIGWVIGIFVAKIGVPSFVISLAFFLGLPGVMLIVLDTGGILRLEVEPIKAIMNANLPVWAGWVLLAAAVLTTLSLSLWDRSRRMRVGLPVRSWVFIVAKVAAFLVFGGVAVFILNQPRSLVAANPIQGVPIVVPIVLFLIFLGTFVLTRTTFGRYIYAVGGNPEAARRAGINVAQIRIYAFMIASTLATIGGLLHVSRIGAVEASAGRTVVLSAVAAAVVGGVSLFGGKGKLLNAAIGAVVISIIDNGLGLLGFPAGISYIVTGSVLALAATVDALARKRAPGGMKV
ncbi:MAG: ABC transporter permease [Aquiluna sp.]|jgi:D-xylose transport system permease protein|nr:ABC transporter permease [Aquiluna sp.]